MRYRRLGKTNLEVSILGFGASPLGNVFEECDENEGIAAVHYAIDHGVNFVDVAPFYGITLAETRLGKALKGKRNEVYLATKAGRYDLREFDFSYQKILSSIDDSLRRLQTDYVDLYQLHDIEFGSQEQVLNEAIPAIQAVKKSGKARFVGITGLPVNYLAAIAREVEIDTVLSWAHYNLLQDEINEELVPLSKELDFGLMNAAPLMQRILSDAALPVWHNASEEVKALQPRLLAICQAYHVRLSDVALRFAMDHPDIATTIVGMCDMKSIQENVAAVDFVIPDGLLHELEEVIAPFKNRMWFEGRPENNIARKP
ncbi:aldo/keto reductase [Aquirufa ecclesiirivi]|uniref:aldo/keto reductase n=1 Tax=Aquirufa ecclesiirivi TaxID=2715124 RepID=UPI0023D86B2B|nr:aldo/keto reductase [Aquirufa ecclesiirivi]MDF0693120.1 aldo/keto reductase [Aquirufa ecclesiirivi]